ncbi:MAG: M28 family peptidase [Salinimicrobium sp.]
MKKASFFLLFLVCSFAGFAQTEAEKVTSTISQDEIKGHIYFLTDDLLKGRETGTPENKIAAAYLSNTLRSYGVKPDPETGSFYQKVMLEKMGPPKIMQLSLNGIEVEQKIAMERADVDFDGEMVFLGYGLKEDYEGKDVGGKLLLLKGGTPDSEEIRAAYIARGDKAELARKAGAAGIIEMVKTNDTLWGMIEHGFNSEGMQIASEETEGKKDLPYMWVNDPNEELLVKLSKQKDLKAKLKIQIPDKEEVISQNVVGFLEGTDAKLKEEYIMYSAHYDHVGIGVPDVTGDTIYNGARDNAVGTTTVLSMADNLSKFPTKRSAIFVLFTGEEKGLLGSKYFVEHPVIPLKKIVFGFNSDNAGYNDTSLATIIGLERTSVAAHIKEAAKTFGITAVDDEAPEQNLFDRSDNVSFAAKGVPAPTFSLGFRTFDGDVTKYYHQAGDEAETLDYDYLLKFFRAYVLAGRLIANDSKTPFWTPGDKYEAVGKELYAN